MSDAVLVAGITALLGGGTIAGLASLITGRATARKVYRESSAIDARLPAEVDSVIVSGAEQAVLTMSRALEHAERRITALEAERDADQTDATVLQERFDTLRVRFDAVRSDLEACRQEAEKLAQRLAANG